MEEWVDKLVCFRFFVCVGEIRFFYFFFIGTSVFLLEKDFENDVWKVGFYEVGLVLNVLGRVCKGVLN